MFQTDTASVLSEAIEYIKFLHEQVNVSTISSTLILYILQTKFISKQNNEGKCYNTHLYFDVYCMYPLQFDLKFSIFMRKFVRFTLTSITIAQNFTINNKTHNITMLLIKPWCNEFYLQMLGI